MKTQLHRLGIGYDWSREINTSSADYYRWTQWLFLLMYRRGLAYRKAAAVNWCRNCETVLANEQVSTGGCWRCQTPVESRQLVQWFLKTTAHADELLKDLDLLEEWPSRVRTMQENWIGRSEGVQLDFALESGHCVRVFTTRQETVFGATFLALAPRHPIVQLMKSSSPIPEAIDEFTARMGARNPGERSESASRKEGVDTGVFAVNPFSHDRIPVWLADYVMMEYGSGAIMGVPAHDERDLEFAVKYGLPVRQVITLVNADGDPSGTDGVLSNSGPYDGLDCETARDRIADDIETRGIGHRAVRYRLRDWLISRQRYWGCPIPIIHCDRCGMTPVPEDELPVLLPESAPLHPAGGPPLSLVPEFYHTTCPSCGGPGRRDTDTMDVFVCSSWYFLRFTSPHDEQFPFNIDEAAYWMPVDQYVGGIEHAVMHLLYARFVTKVLKDAGMLTCPEPFRRLLTQGMVTLDGETMSKSKGNVVSPVSVLEQYGADVLRTFILFASPPEKGLDWSEQGLEGVDRFLSRVWRLVTSYAGRLNRPEPELEHESLGEGDRTLHRRFSAVCYV